MNKGLLACCAVVALAMSGICMACGNSPVMSTRKSDDTRVGLFIPREVIEATSRWNPDQGEPPLSFAAAYLAMKEWARNHYTRYDDVGVRDISLRRYGCSSVADRWYYVFDLAMVIDGTELWGDTHWAAVLFDGTVIAPREYRSEVSYDD
jgi:hypothetical protein